MEDINIQLKIIENKINKIIRKIKMIILERILYVIIILFCLYKLMIPSCTNNFNSELIHPSFFGRNF
jgi:hypothetical protein